VTPTLGEPPSENLDWDEYLLRGGTTVVAVLVPSVVQPGAGGEDHGASASQDPGPGDLHLIVLRSRGRRPPPLAAAGAGPYDRARAVQDVPVVGGEHDHPPRLERGVQQPPEGTQGGQVPPHPHLVAAAEVVVDAVHDNAHDALVGVGDELADIVGQGGAGRGHQRRLVQQDRRSGRV